MKRITLLLAISFALTAVASAQNADLMKWKNDTPKPVSTESSVEKNEKTETPTKNWYIGLGIGYASEGYMPMNFHLTYKKVYYGFSVAIPVSKGVKGDLYTVVNWDEMSEDHIDEGTYYTPITFDVGYDIKSFTIGAGIGIAVGTKYRNCYDKYHILGNNGAYYKEVSDGSSGEFKVFAKYRFPSKSGIHCYLSAQYTIKTGIGATFGIDI